MEPLPLSNDDVEPIIEPAPKKKAGRPKKQKTPKQAAKNDSAAPSAQIDDHPEIIRMRAILDQQAAELATLRAQLEPKAPTPQIPESEWPHFLVSVPHGPRWVVAAPDEANAMMAYMKACGMTSYAPENQPSIGRTTEPLGNPDLVKHGIVG